MFIIDCERDHSYCEVDDNEVIFDKSHPPKVGDEVMFFLNKTQEKGRVVMISDNESKIKRMLDFYKKKSTDKRKLSTSPSETTNQKAILPTKRPRKVNAKYASSSFENLEMIKPRKELQPEKGSADENKKKRDKIRPIVRGKELKKKNNPVCSKEIETSPSKDELKMMLVKAQGNNEFSKSLNAGTHSERQKTIELTKKNDKLGNISSATDSELDDSVEHERSGNLKDTSGSIDSDFFNVTNHENDNNDKENFENSGSTNNDNEKNKLPVNPVDTDIDDPDLYGKNWPEEPMIKLISQVYCKKSNFDLIKSLCNQASHVVRRLIPGVFKPSGYVHSTFSGQAPRAHKGEGKPAPVKALNDTAKNEIIDFALKMAAEKNWTTRNGIPQTKEDLKKVMSQRIGELNREIELNNKKQASI